MYKIICFIILIGIIVGGCKTPPSYSENPQWHKQQQKIAKEAMK